ncbi:immunoglobulin-like domain-containing receptor 2 isoform X1 [Stegostoma tigrinum]|uniref:immunoglobulin-like domain-containing receptor 2 isoform X1 n=1 Tax=Stegostoma tigrinum TaxID=3053191 RepID=UPI00287014D1|nr:immunoglobulin-like domain-containing receptor 2 isoform X1 [Stegostoma tigrinum]XP_059506257.1 immunoglobulin-like domain-containing receptor 2 isoform X1 [Stegostoma tigrinum]XP_059506258.1 immunoglobulin-like domain-containing receptor 2 isoform X1 [Stegostoma tigrinum]
MWVSGFSWWMPIVCLAGVSLGVQVTISEQKKIAMLFQPVVLHCQYSTTSAQQPVVQWRFKSYCKDRTRDAFSIHSTAAHVISQKEQSPTWDPYLDCADNSRTVRIVASRQGSAVTLGEYYKGREITIINNADLQIGRLHWGDSGAYYCSVITPDDIVGNSEQRMELLVLGRSEVVADLLPSFDVEIMPEWAFVALVLSGSLIFLILLGVCWCQCCPHTCCCYVRCPCCPESCCCPRALYAAGKAVKAGHLPNVAAYPSYYIPRVPISPSVIDSKPLPPTARVDNDMGGSVRSGYRIQANKEQDSMKVLYYVEKELAQFDPSRRKYEQSSNMSELSSLHDQDSDFRQTFPQTRKQVLPAITAQDDDSAFRGQLTRGSGHFKNRERRDDEPCSSRSRSRSRSCERQRIEFHDKDQTRSLDELEQFAESYHYKGRRGNSLEPERWERKSTDRGDYYRALRDRYHYQDSSLDDYYNKRSRSRNERYDTDQGHIYNSQRKRDRQEEYPLRCTNEGIRAYDDAFMSNVLERKAKCKSYNESYGSETPSKTSIKRGNDHYYGKPPSYRAEEEETLPPYSEMHLQRLRPEELAGKAYYQKMECSHERKEQTRQKKANHFPARDALVV